MFWEIKDPGRKKLEPLEADVQRLLNDQNEYLKLREACNLSFSIFMVGRQETTSCPTLVIISANTISRKKVVGAIRGSRILDKYEGVLLGQSSRHPRHPHSGPPKQIASGIGQGSSQAAEIGVAVYVKKPGLQLLSGTAIYIPVDDSKTHALGRFRKATLGGFLELKRKDGTVITVGMTVAHVFQPVDWNQHASLELEKPDEDTFEFEFDGPTPETCLDSGSNAPYLTTSGKSLDL